MRAKRSLIVVAVCVVFVPGVIFLAWRRPRLDVAEILSVYQPGGSYDLATITDPPDGALFPPEIAAPTFRWEERQSRCDAWVVALRFQDGQSDLNVITYEPLWTPQTSLWETIKKRSLDSSAEMMVLGVNRSRPTKILTRGRISLRISKDKVGAPLFYREVNLPFVEAVKDPSNIRWRFGSISSETAPPVVLDNMPVCGNCHSFCRDGRILAMDVDYANSKGSYVMTPVAQEMVLATSDIVTWNDYRKEDGEQTFGLLSQISPDGRYVISTVKDKSVFVPKPGLAFSQLFFPIKGILCVYDRQTGQFSALPGADDPQYVQSNPTWSPDGQYIVFARSKTYQLKAAQDKNKVLLSPADCAEFLEEGKQFVFDLYRIPFNDGRGGTPVPLEGASGDGMSNYFAKYSPDGKWIVFCKAASYMLLQPDSKLYIIPAEGGAARRLECNTGRMNSWHSFSPNGKWLVFSSKAYSDYTQLFLTHLDEAGRSSPAIVLSRLTAPDRAANIPEFVNATPQAIERIREQFLDDYSFVRSGDAFFRYGDADDAIREYRKALELNPNNAWAHRRLGFLLYNAKGSLDEGLSHLRTALALEPRDPRSHHDLGMALLHRAEFEPAIEHLGIAVRGMPEGHDVQYDPVQMRYSLGWALLACGRSRQALPYLSQVLRRDPNHAEAHYGLAVALAELKQPIQSATHFIAAMKLKPSVDTSPTLHHLLAGYYLEQRAFGEALAHEERALVLARAVDDPALIEPIEKRLRLCRRLVESSQAMR